MDAWPNTNTPNLVLSIKDRSISLARLGDNEIVYAFDGAGRLMSAFVEARTFRQGMDGRLYARERQKHPERSRWQTLDSEEYVSFYARLLEFVARFRDQLQDGACQIISRQLAGNEARVAQSAKPDLYAFASIWLDQILTFQKHKRSTDRERFSRLYHRVSILPPDQYRSLVVQVTQGCAYNRCTFCHFYKDTSFGVKSRREIQQHLEGVVSFWGPSLAARQHIFLADANALMLPQDHLLWIFDTLNERFSIGKGAKGGVRFDPERARLVHNVAFEGIYSFLDVVTPGRKSASDLAQLRQRGLRRVYVGLETGNSDLLGELGKPLTTLALTECVQALHEGGVCVGLIILVGIGGETWFETHVRDSIAVVNELGLGQGDLIYLSRLVEHSGGSYADWAAAAGIAPLPPARIEEQYARLASGFVFPEKRNRPRVSPYSVDEFVY